MLTILAVGIAVNSREITPNTSFFRLKNSQGFEITNIDGNANASME